MKPIKIVNGIIPFKGYMAMMTLFILWIRKEYANKIDEYVLNHENIHMYQQLEILVVCLVPSIILYILNITSWWWILLSIFSPLIIYVLCWIIEILLPPYNSAYKNICFESEAIYNERDLDYLTNKRKLFDFSWVKYISNKKHTPVG